jgi:hypothetical protein
MTSATYPLTLDHASDIIEQLRLSPSETIIEPSPCAAYLLDHLNAATAFRLRFNAERLPYDDPAQFLMFALADEETEPWLGSCGGEWQKVEFVVVRFGCEEDQVRFEEMLWPER